MRDSLSATERSKNRVVIACMRSIAEEARLADGAGAGQPASQVPQAAWQAVRGHGWHFVCFGILVIAALARLFDLESKPLHHDEGVNGYFLLILLRSGVYRYDPA